LGVIGAVWEGKGEGTVSKRIRVGKKVIMVDCKGKGEEIDDKRKGGRKQYRSPESQIFKCGVTGK